MDIILPFFDPLPCVDSFYTLNVDKNKNRLTPSPPLDLVHVVIEWPLGLAAKATAVAWIDFRTMPN